MRQAGKVLGTIKLDGKPEFAATDAKGEIFVNIEDKSELVAIDPNKLEVKSKWPLAPCTEPSGLSMDRKNRRLYVGCDNKMMAIVDADSLYPVAEAKHDYLQMLKWNQLVADGDTENPFLGRSRVPDERSKIHGRDVRCMEQHHLLQY